MAEKETTITFRVNNEDIVAFKKYQLLLKNKENTPFNTQKTFVYLLQKAKNIFEKSNILQTLEQEDNFVERLTSIGKKNLMLSNPKILTVTITEPEKQLFYQIGYTIQKNDNVGEISYPYIFKRLLELQFNNMKEDNIADRLQFRVEDKLYQEFKMFHINFLETTQYFNVQDIKDFFILLIEEWHIKLKEQKKLKPEDPDKITYINRKGKRIGKLSYEGETARITFYFKKHIVSQWNDIIYTLMYEDNFQNLKEYSNGYFFPHLYNFAKENIEYLVSKYQKHLLNSFNLKLEEEITIRIINKHSTKKIEGKVTTIENTPEGLIIHLDKTEK